MNVGRNTIVMQALIAELAIANPEDCKALRVTFKKGKASRAVMDVLHTVPGSA